MKLATAQTFVSSDISANGAAIRLSITRAAAGGTRLIVFCEGALSGYAKSQIIAPAEWAEFDWAKQETELRIFAAIGGAHRIADGYPPHNSLYVLSDEGVLLTRYDKRFLSNTELGGWYTPGIPHASLRSMVTVSVVRSVSNPSSRRSSPNMRGWMSMVSCLLPMGYHPISRSRCALMPG